MNTQQIFHKYSIKKYKNNLLAREQHGFVRNKSCTTNLLENLDYILSNLDVATS